MTKPRLLVIGPTYAVATNRRKLWALAEDFQVTCATSQLIGNEIFGRPAEEFEEQGTQEPIELHRFHTYPSRQENTRIVYRGIGKLFRSTQFNYILVESEPWGLIKWQAWFLSRRFQRKALFGEFSWENVERSRLKGLLLSLCYRLSGLADDYIICGNQACRQVFVKYGARKCPILVAPQLGVDMGLCRPASVVERSALRKANDIPETALLVGYCGRLSPEKGITELCEAVRPLHEQHPELHLALLGDGPCRERLAARKDPWLHLFEPRPHFEVPNFLRCLDIFVLASKPLRTRGHVWEEQFGHVLIEAMACRIATIGSNSGAILEVLGDPSTLFPHSNVAGLIDLLRKTIEDESFRSELAEKQHGRALKLFSHEAVARLYTDFLLNLKPKFHHRDTEDTKGRLLTANGHE